jgi:hypothetical protein
MRYYGLMPGYGISGVKRLRQQRGRRRIAPLSIRSSTYVGQGCHVDCRGAYAAGEALSLNTRSYAVADEFNPG